MYFSFALIFVVLLFFSSTSFLNSAFYLLLFYYCMYSLYFCFVFLFPGSDCSAMIFHFLSSFMFCYLSLEFVFLKFSLWILILWCRAAFLGPVSFRIFMLERGPEYGWDLTRLLSFESFSLCFFPTSRVMQHCFLFISNPKYLFFPTTIETSLFPANMAGFFVSPLVNEQVSTFASSENKIGYRGAPVGAAQRFEFRSVSAKHTSFSMKATAAVLSLPPVYSCLISVLQGGGSATDFATWVFSCILVSLKMMFVTFSFCPWIFSECWPEGRKRSDDFYAIICKLESILIKFF